MNRYGRVVSIPGIILWVIGINLTVYLALLVTRFLASGLFNDLLYFLWLLPRPHFFTQPWGLLTSVFTHYDLWHLAGNTFTLFFFGRFLAEYLGEKRFLLLYLGGGLIGSIFFVLLQDGGPAIGASGAVFALGGALTVLQPRVKVFIIPIPVPMPLWVAVIGGFVILSLFPSVAWEAHLGGLVFGLALGYYYRQRGRRSWRNY
ncbi:rhomboid family intramembrane serine protease [Chloroflexota bacterium]